jgi:hypothetical protein
MGSQSPPKPELLSLLEMCRWELDRLPGIASEYRVYNETCRDFMLTAGDALEEPSGSFTQAAQSPLGAPASYQFAAALSPTLQNCRDRAEEHRAFAERASDPRVKILLLEIAEAYEKVGNRE